MDKGKNNSSLNNSDLSRLNMKAIGNYTKDAVKNFENHIVEQNNYLEKVDKALKEKK